VLQILQRFGAILADDSSTAKRKACARDLELAPKQPDVRFQYAAGLWTDTMPANICSCLVYIGMK
jgi:hypothetical protein